MLDQHPRIKELKAQIGEVERAMRSEGERLARQLDNDAKVAGDRLETLTASLDTVKKLASQTNEQDVQLRALEREAKTAARSAGILSGEIPRGLARATISTPRRRKRASFRAQRPAIKPVYPKKMPTILIAAFAAFALSAGFTVTGALLAPAACALCLCLCAGDLSRAGLSCADMPMMPRWRRRP